MPSPCAASQPIVSAHSRALTVRGNWHSCRCGRHGLRARGGTPEASAPHHAQPLSAPAAVVRSPPRDHIRGSCCRCCGPCARCRGSKTRAAVRLAPPFPVALGLGKAVCPARRAPAVRAATGHALRVPSQRPRHAGPAADKAAESVALCCGCAAHAQAPRLADAAKDVSSVCLRSA
ncbi:hypothetical protein, conserved in T. vivax, partial [Trypanosoma vivax Y486]